MTLHVRPAFYRDLEQQQLWLLAHVSPEVADKWFAAVGETVRFLHTNPEVGRVRKDLKHAGVRSWLVTGFHRWTIFYGLKNDSLILYRVVGGEMNLRALTLA